MHRLNCNLILLFFAFAAMPLFGVEQNNSSNSNEAIMLKSLIEATQRSLEQQKALLEQVKKYQEMQQSYLQQPEDKDLLLQVAKSAQRLLENIQANHLTQAFEPDFLSELTLFSQVAAKRGAPKP